MPLDQDTITAIVSRISYKNWGFALHKKGDGFLLQVQFKAPDAMTRKLEVQKGRKWYVSSHACEAEIVRTAYKAIEAAEIHELQENFKYMGQAIFGPHHNPEDIAILMAMEFLGQSTRQPQSNEPAVKRVLGMVRGIMNNEDKPNQRPRKANGKPIPGSSRVLSDRRNQRR